MLKEEVSKMLQKGAMESVYQPGTGFYSHLFLVQKATGAGVPHRFVHAEWVCHADQVTDGDSNVGFGVDSEGRLDVLY